VEREVVVAALEAERAALGAALRDRVEADFQRPTRCVPWTVRELLAHVLVAGRRLGPMLADPAPPRIEHDAFDYFARDHRGGGVDVERIGAARALAATIPTVGALVAAVDESWRDTTTLVDDAPHGRLVLTRWDERMAVADYAATRVVELAVHGLDLAEALDHPPWITPPALGVAAEVLGRSLPSEAVTRLGWDDWTLVTVTTGRRSVSADDETRVPGLRQHLLWPA
jgi:uncharacterized protein (TIGR03083 family)